LKTANETEIIDELRVIISDNENTTAYFTFSSQIFPRIQQLRVYGSKNSLVIDDMRQTLIRTNSNYTYYLNHVVPSLLYAKQYGANAAHNIMQFIHRDFHFESGRKFLIESFYRSVTDGAPLPISFREILVTSKIMDSIFHQIYTS
jgi:predicted dehydrogenase